MSQPFNIDSSHPMPLYAQLERTIRFAIATGRLQAGEQLPTVRQLAVELCINANTVAKVYSELERAGLLETRRGVGTFVSNVSPEEDARENRERQLGTLVDRFVAEAGAHGFSVDDLIEHLQSRRKKEMRKNG